VCPPMRVSFAVFDAERVLVSSAAAEARGDRALGAGQPKGLMKCVLHQPDRYDCWHDLALEVIQARGEDLTAIRGSGGGNRTLYEATAMLRTAFRLLGGIRRIGSASENGCHRHGSSRCRSEQQARARVSQHLSLLLDALGAKYGALHHAALAATSGGDDVRDVDGIGAHADRWLNLATMCRDMCLYRCAMASLDAYLSLSCSSLRCKGSHLRTASVESWGLLQRAGALGSLHSADTYRSRLQLLNLSVKYATATCRSWLAGGHRSKGENGEVQKDVPVLEAADVMAMPIAPDIMEDFARCEARKVLESLNASRPIFSFRLAVQAAFFGRRDRGAVRVGYISVIDACRVHNSMFRALFDLEMVGHARSQAFTFVWTTHMIEKRAGYASPPACVRASSAAIEVRANMSVAEVAQLINAQDIHVLVDLWGWAPLGRSVRSLDILALAPAAVSAVMLGSLNSPSGGLAQFVVSDRVCSPPDLMAHSMHNEHGRSEMRALLPPSFIPSSHNPLMPVAPWMGERGAGDDQERRVRGAHGWLPHDDSSRRGRDKGGRGVVMMAASQLFALDPLLLDIWLRLVRRKPNLVLALTANAYAFLGMQAIAARAAELRVPDAQIKWHQRVLEDEAYMQRLSAADLFLDTTWHNSMGSAIDSLWAATPVLTLAGERPSSRVAASLMIAAGTSLTLARDLNDYSALAGTIVRLTTQGTRRQALRKRLEQARASRLFNSSRWVALWESWLAVAVDLHISSRDLHTERRRFHLVVPDSAVS